MFDVSGAVGEVEVEVEVDARGAKLSIVADIVDKLGGQHSQEVQINASRQLNDVFKKKSGMNCT